MQFEDLNNVQEHGGHGGVSEEQLIGGRSKKIHPDGFDRPDLSFGRPENAIFGS